MGVPAAAHRTYGAVEIGRVSASSWLREEAARANSHREALVADQIRQATGVVAAGASAEAAASTTQAARAEPNPEAALAAPEARRAVAVIRTDKMGNRDR
jgi:hypothetical protein